MTDADLVMAAINRHPDPSAASELAEALGLHTYMGVDITQNHRTVPTMRVGLLDQEGSHGNR